MEYGDIHAHAVDIDTSAGELISFCPGGLTALADTRHERQFVAHTFISAALDRTNGIASVRRSH